jgi:hypothetical protein
MGPGASLNLRRNVFSLRFLHSRSVLRYSFAEGVCRSGRIHIELRTARAPNPHDRSRPILRNCPEPAFWAIPTMMLSEAAAAATFGLISSLGATRRICWKLCDWVSQRSNAFTNSQFCVHSARLCSGGRSDPQSESSLSRWGLAGIKLASKATAAHVASLARPVTKVRVADHSLMAAKCVSMAILNHDEAYLRCCEQRI